MTGSTMRVLLIDERQADAVLIQNLLAHSVEQFAVDHVQRLDEALALLDTQTYDCAVLDLSLSDVALMEAIVALRAADPAPAVVVLSGTEDDDVTIKALEMGAEGFLTRGHLDQVLVSRAVRYGIARKRAEQGLVHRALHDPLTGLPNGLALDQQLPVALQRADRRGTKIGLLFVDIDGFADLKRRYGAAASEEVVATMAHRLSGVARDSDIVARMFGGEFVIVCEDLTLDVSVKQLALRVKEMFKQPVRLSSGTVVVVHPNLGFAAGDSSTSPAALLRRTNILMIDQGFDPTQA